MIRSHLLQPELGTHLNVLDIQRTNRYDDANSTETALGVMKERFAGNQFEIEGTDLHFAFLGNDDLNDGEVFDASICDSQRAFGIVSEIVGNFESVDQSMLYDFKTTAHHLGHM